MKYCIYVALLILTLCFAVTSVPAQQPVSQTDLNALLERAEKSTRNYIESFKNLVAEESKTIEKFSKDGSLDDTRRIKSTFIVYQLQNNDEVSEFRSVSEFNGKKVGRNDNEAIKFFGNLSVLKTAEKELSQLERESTRYDGQIIVWGVTLRQGLILQEKARPFFNFQIVRTEQIAGRNVFVVEYKQKESTDYVNLNSKKSDDAQGEKLSFRVNLPDSFDPASARLSGYFWLDAETGQIWKDEQLLSVSSKSLLEAETVIVRNDFEYQASKYNVLVPKKFILTINQVQSKNKDFKAQKFFVITLEYSAFNTVNSEVKDYQIKGN
jgi:hypothetical protein